MTEVNVNSVKDVYSGVDTGSTGVRVTLVAERFEDVKEYSNFVAIYNALADQDPKKKVGEDFKYEDTQLLKITITPKKKIDNEVAQSLIRNINNNLWLAGTIATNISTNARQLLPNLRKSVQVETYINIISSITAAMKANRLTEVNMRLRTLLPPTEYLEDEATRTSSDVLGNSTIVVENQITNDRFIINLGIFDQRSEGQAAVSYSLVDEKGVPTELADKVFDSTFILFDAGENTFDIIPLKDGKIVGGKIRTLTSGSKYMLGILGEALEAKYRFKPADDNELRKIFDSGFIKIGATKTNVSDLISDANREYVDYWYPDFDKYLITNRLALQSISGFIFVGGASKQANEKVIELGEAFKKRIDTIVPGIPVLTPKDPRRANILGLQNQLRALREKGAPIL